MTDLSVTECVARAGHTVAHKAGVGCFELRQLGPLSALNGDVPTVSITFTMSAVQGLPARPAGVPAEILGATEPVVLLCQPVNMGAAIDLGFEPPTGSLGCGRRLSACVIDEVGQRDRRQSVSVSGRPYRPNCSMSLRETLSERSTWRALYGGFGDDSPANSFGSSCRHPHAGQVSALAPNDFRYSFTLFCTWIALSARG